MTDSYLKQLWKHCHEVDASIRVWAVVGGHVVSGLVQGGKAFVEDANQWIDEQSESLKEAGLSDEQIKGICFEAEKDQKEDTQFITLGDAIVFMPFQRLDLKSIRVDVSQIGAWWIGEPENNPDEDDSDASDESVLDEAA